MKDNPKPTPVGVTSFALSAWARPPRRPLPRRSPKSAHADTESNEEKRKARYRETEHVKAYYRVNRYPG